MGTSAAQAHRRTAPLLEHHPSAQLRELPAYKVYISCTFEPSKALTVGSRCTRCPAPPCWSPQSQRPPAQGDRHMHEYSQPVFKPYNLQGHGHGAGLETATSKHMDHRACEGLGLKVHMQARRSMVPKMHQSASCCIGCAHLLGGVLGPLSTQECHGHEVVVPLQVAADTEQYGRGG
jgi:hypothetical protein